MLDVLNPFDLRVIASIDSHDEAALERMIENAVAFYRAHPKGIDLAERLAVLERLRARMRADFDLLCATALAEGGKPLRDTRVEVERAIAGVGLAIDELKGAAAHKVTLTAVPSGDRFEAIRESRPIGPVAALSAFNHPLNLLIHQAIPALATGCPVIVKPSEKVPLTALLLDRMIHEAGCPAYAWQTLITADISLAAALASDPRIAFVTFIGSARVGWGLRARLAPGTRCVLEHGGVAPALLLDDVDIEAAIPKIAHGAFYHAGQVCISIQKLIVPRRLEAEVTEALQRRIAALRVGDPADAATDVGPLIRPAEVARVDDWIGEAIGGGAEVVAGGQPIGETCYEPTLITAVPHASRLWTQEVFGPVLVIEPYDTLDEALALAAHPIYAFQSAVFGSDPARCRAVADALPGSTVMINEHTAFRTDDMPFAGLGQSGLGIGGIGYTMRDMSVERQTIVRQRG